MTERELRAALRRAAPVAPDARERAWRVARAAHAGAAPAPRGRRRRAVAIVLVALGTSAAGGVAVGAPGSGLVRELLGVPSPHVRPQLLRVPGGGRLLVTARSGAWVVAADGAKRRLGAYDGASWSPRGRFVVAWRDRAVTALAPDGGVRWSLGAPGRVRVARWAPGDGYRIAYVVAGGRLRIVNGDGTGDRPYARVAPAVTPDWRPRASHVLAYADRRGRIVVAAVDAGRPLWRTAPVDGVRALGWSPDGERLLVLARERLLVLDARGRVRARRGIAAAGAAWSPDGREIALVRRADGAADVALLDLAAPGRPRTLVRGPGRLGPPVWSPDGRRLLVPWADADQWLLLRLRGGGVAAVGGVARQFAPGSARARPPRAIEWCCRR